MKRAVKSKAVVCKAKPTVEVVEAVEGPKRVCAKRYSGNDTV